MVKDIPYDTDEKNLDSIHLVFGNICNLAEIFDDQSVINDTIKKMNAKIGEAKDLPEDIKKQEKMYLIDVMKTSKSNIALSHQEFKEHGSQPNQESKILSGGKESIKIELKK